MKKQVLLLALVLVILITSSGNIFAKNIPYDKNEIESYILDYVEKWVFDNYSEHYYLTDYTSTISELEITNDKFKALIPVVLKTTLKYDDVESLPYVEGIKDALSISFIKEVVDITSTERNTNPYTILSKANPHLNSTQIQNVLDILTDQYYDIKECINTATLLSLDFVVTGDIVNDEITNISLYIDQMGEIHDASLYIPKSKQELKEIGKSDMVEYLDSKESQIRHTAPTGYSRYDRIVARDYALEYTSNATKYCKCGELYGVDYDYWNNSEYPYFDNACHNDCADYVSQAMHEGGIPIEAGKWERLKDGNSGYGPYGWTWTNVAALKDYMTSKGYWDKSNFAQCNAGNILLTSSSHIVMVTLNDTVTHRYSGHTRDRKNYQFYDNSDYQYYTIKTN